MKSVANTLKSLPQKFVAFEAKWETQRPPKTKPTFTYEMLEVTTRNSHAQIISDILTFFPTNTSFANFLLDKGADPNSGGFGPLSNLYSAVKGPPLGLVRKMVERGANVHDEAAIKQALEAEGRLLLSFSYKQRREPGVSVTVTVFVES